MFCFVVFFKLENIKNNLHQSASEKKLHQTKFFWQVLINFIMLFRITIIILRISLFYHFMDFFILLFYGLIYLLIYLFLHDDDNFLFVKRKNFRWRKFLLKRKMPLCGNEWLQELYFFSLPRNFFQLKNILIKKNYVTSLPSPNNWITERSPQKRSIF